MLSLTSLYVFSFGAGSKCSWSSWDEALVDAKVDTGIIGDNVGAFGLEEASVCRTEEAEDSISLCSSQSW